MTADDTRGVDAFFDSYLQAFERFDVAAIAGHFAFPGHVTADSGDVSITAVADERTWLGQLERLLAMYRGIDVASAKIMNLDATALSPRLFQAVVKWRLHDRSGATLYEFDAAYTLVLSGDVLKIAAIAHNEMPRYRECVARLRAATEKKP